jgi:hypothetical protein
LREDIRAKEKKREQQRKEKAYKKSKKQKTNTVIYIKQPKMAKPPKWYGKMGEDWETWKDAMENAIGYSAPGFQSE